MGAGPARSIDRAGFRALVRAISSSLLVRFDEAKLLTLLFHLEPEDAAAYCHGILHGEKLSELNAHLAVCRDCRNLVAEIVRSESIVSPDENGRPK